MRWLELGNDRCPVSRRKLARPVALTTDIALRVQIHEWAETHALWLLVSRQRRTRSVPLHDRLPCAPSPAA